jgi:hypothetical protein
MIRRIKEGDYADIHSQFDLPRVSEARRSWHGEPGGTTTMTEIVTTLLAFFWFQRFPGPRIRCIPRRSVD